MSKFMYKELLNEVIIIYKGLVLSETWKHKITWISRVFANGPGDHGSIPGRHAKYSKMVLDPA